MEDGRLEQGPIHRDVRSLQGIPGAVDIVFGGFPCQDISTAGKRAGLDGERSGLYREVVRLVAECGPSFVFLENVAAIRGSAWRVVEDLARLGFDCRWTSLSAAEVGAPHKRDRWWLLAAHTERLKLRLESGRSSGPDGQGAPLALNAGEQGDVGDAYSYSESAFTVDAEAPGLCGVASRTPGWSSPPEFRGMDDGVPHRLDRNRALGNAVVPAQARAAFKHLMGFV